MNKKNIFKFIWKTAQNVNNWYKYNIQTLIIYDTDYEKSYKW